MQEWTIRGKRRKREREREREREKRIWLREKNGIGNEDGTHSHINQMKMGEEKGIFPKDTSLYKKERSRGVLVPLAWKDQ